MEKQLRAMLAAQALGAVLAMPMFAYIGYMLFTVLF